MASSFLVLLLVGLIGLVILFAQLKLFSIDSILSGILEELQKANRITAGCATQPI